MPTYHRHCQHSRSWSQQYPSYHCDPEQSRYKVCVPVHPAVVWFVIAAFFQAASESLIYCMSLTTATGAVISVVVLKITNDFHRVYQVLPSQLCSIHSGHPNSSNCFCFISLGLGSEIRHLVLLLAWSSVYCMCPCNGVCYVAGAACSRCHIITGLEVYKSSRYERYTHHSFDRQSSLQSQSSVHLWPPHGTHYWPGTPHITGIKRPQ